MNKLYFGDNLEILRGPEIEPASVDLVYLDPPFNSQAQYNVLFSSPRDTSSAQAGAFVDTWSWGEESELCFQDAMKLGTGVSRFLDALRSALNESDLMAYLAMMAVRLDALREKLKPSGSLFLHCDPTASHYLKVLLDGIFGPRNFKNEIVWRRSHPKGHAFTRFATSHDVIFYYAKDPKHSVWNQLYTPHDPENAAKQYSLKDLDGRRYQLTSLLNPNNDRPNLTYEFLGATKVWRWTKSRMEDEYAKGRIIVPKEGTGIPRYKRYLDEQEGIPIGDFWDDIGIAAGKERTGYPTQKPVALMTRIIDAASRKGDVILDPFCGCGTTIEAAELAGRQWIGIDVAIHAIKVIEIRLADRFGEKVKFKTAGIPRDFDSAERLARDNKYQFQWWANYLFNPHALREQKKGKDRGVDGDVFFPNGPGRPWGRMLTSVKGGDNVGPAMVRDFAHVLDREKAEMGLFICLKKPTREMAREASGCGIAKTIHGDIPKLQIVAIEDWFAGKFPKLPPLEHLPSAAFTTARRRMPVAGKRADPEQPELPLSFTGGSIAKQSVVHFNPHMVRSVA